ncbi:MAG: hypothetical protein B9S33_22475 [Pedosphaera sp. Tous-C6FEB]|nr:MAG: hypothetical protein B9S33_22475 [Pedosphaera sp. Tous-C6FEB]
MAEPFPILLAAELLPLEMPAPNSGRPVGPAGNSLPVVEATLLAALLVLLAFALTRRRPRKRKTHRPRNPTLAETGGLPPPRPRP